LRLLFNPYIYELDSRQYFQVYKDILAKGSDTSWLTGQRNAFPLFMMYSKYVAGIGFIGFTKFITPILFYLTCLPLFEYSQKIKNKLLGSLSYLLILGSPYLIISNEGIRPESFIILLTIPIFYLLFNSIQESTIAPVVLTILTSYTAFRFHQLGIFLLLSALTAFLIITWDNRKNIGNYLKKNPLLITTIIIPYAIIISDKTGGLRSLFQAGIFYDTTRVIIEGIQSAHWRWWFLDNFVNFEGGVAQWPGYSFIYYYAFNGITLIISFFIISFLYYKIKGSRQKLVKIFLPLLPIAIFTFIYFSRNST
jgi:hypothetical protein